MHVKFVTLLTIHIFFFISVIFFFDWSSQINDCRYFRLQFQQSQNVCVLGIYLLLKHNSIHPQIKKKKVSFGFQFAEFSGHSRLLPRQGSMGEEIDKEKATIGWVVRIRETKRVIKGRGKKIHSSRLYPSDPVTLGYNVINGLIH